jgi:MerR family transcriptional regulator, copper efflux regulator
MGDTLRIGELAEQAGVTTRTIRYYESIGLLSPTERDGGFRYYTDDALRRLHKIDALKRLGLSLEEISTVIDLYFEDPSGVAAKQRVLAILEGHLRETEGKISALEQFRDDLQSNIERMEAFIKAAPNT